MVKVPTVGFVSIVTVEPSAIVTLSPELGTTPPGQGEPTVVELQFPLPVEVIFAAAVVAWLPLSAELCAPSPKEVTRKKYVVDGVRPVTACEVAFAAVCVTNVKFTLSVD